MTNRKSKSAKAPRYAMCINAGDYRVDLRFGRVYVVAKPLANDRREMLRIIDESGEDYLYPANWFVPVDLPAKARRALASVA